MSRPTPKYVIKDWAGNTLNFKGRFQNMALGGVPMEFDDAEDAIAYMDGIGVPEEDRDEYYVEPKNFGVKS